MALLELVAFWPLTGSADIARSHTSVTKALDRMLMRPVHRPIAPVPSAAHPILMTGEPFRNRVTSDECQSKIVPMVTSDRRHGAA